MTYDASRELKAISESCLEGIPYLKDNEYEILEDLELKKTRAMGENRTAFLIKEIHRYAAEQKVLRTTHMGETRGGKSEGGVMMALIQLHYFNKLLLDGHYDNVDVNLLKEPVNFSVNNIHRNKTDYINYIRESFKNKTLKYGEVNVIDEKEDSGGGLGSMTELAEVRNYNNMAAKYNLGEHWIEPRGFIEMNTSYGIHWFKKDIKKRVNWGLLYRLEAWSKGINPQTFLGWVCFPLHQHKELRLAYEQKKNHWIDELIAGGGDPRAIERRKAAEIVAQNPLFASMRTEKSFTLTNDQQIDLIDDMIADGKLQGFNAQERTRIMGRAQLIVKMRLYPSLFSNEQIGND